jgi:UDP-N-acetylmuramoyl-tripeptide--D-alanyl-D-alanine ligase
MEDPMESISLGQLARWISAEVPADARADAVVTQVSIDTRTLRPGAAFFAISGESFDGARFVRQAFQRGARAAVVARGAAVDVGPGRPVLRVDDPKAALAALARAWRDALGFKVVAVTGSAGKTTTKDLLHHLLREHLGAVRAPASFNNDVGVPLTLLSTDRATDVAVVEVGTSGPGEIGRLGAIARPDVAILTCIAPAHLEGLGSIEGVAREKLSLLEHLRPGGAAVLNGDDLRLRGAASALAAARGAGAARTVGLGAGLGWRARPLPAPGGGGRHEVRGPDGERLVIAPPIPGEPFLRSTLLALAAADALGVPAARAAAALGSFRAPPGRMDVRDVRGVTLIDDTYNANPASVGAALETLAGLAAPDERLVVLGGMAELGRAAAEHHRTIGRAAARLGLARLVTVGEDAREVARGAREAGLAPGRIDELASADDVARALAPHLSRGRRAVLFKASRVHGLERAVAAVRALLVAPARAAA